MREERLPAGLAAQYNRRTVFKQLARDQRAQNRMEMRTAGFRSERRQGQGLQKQNAHQARRWRGRTGAQGWGSMASKARCSLTQRGGFAPSLGGVVVQVRERSAGTNAPDTARERGGHGQLARRGAGREVQFGHVDPEDGRREGRLKTAGPRCHPVRQSVAAMFGLADGDEYGDAADQREGSTGVWREYKNAIPRLVEHLRARSRGGSRLLPVRALRIARARTLESIASVLQAASLLKPGRAVRGRL